MTKQTADYCLALLTGMPSQSPWTEATNLVYMIALDSWHDDVALATIEHAIKNCRWRPSPAELRDNAITLICPEPSQQQVRAEIAQIIVRVSDNARRDSVAGPMTAIVVSMLGGWDAIGRSDSEDIDRRVAGAYPQARTRYAQTIGEAAMSDPIPDRARLVSGVTDALMVGARR